MFCVCVLVSKRYEKRHPVCLTPKNYLPTLQTTAGGRCVNDTDTLNTIFFLLYILCSVHNIKWTLRPEKGNGVSFFSSICYALHNIGGSWRASQSAVEASESELVEPVSIWGTLILILTGTK